MIRSLQFMALSLILASAFIAPATTAGGTNDFLFRSYTNSGQHVLRYRLLPPKRYSPTNSYPVILYLHGAAARGDDNVSPLDWGPLLFLDPPARAKHDFFLVVPQCPRSGGWVESESPTARPRRGEPLAMAMELISQALPREFSLDPKRRYLTGVSMGGHATWVALARQPGFFAAAVPVCSGGEANWVTDAAARCPVWVFHSDDDHLVPVHLARDMVKAWRAHGGTAKYTEYTGLKHSSWKKAYVDAAMFDWLFQQRLP